MPDRDGRARIQQFRDKFAAKEREEQALAEATAMVRYFNGVMIANEKVWAWPTIGAALISKHHWLVIACDSCGTILDLDLRVKRRDPDASVGVALPEARCPRCNGHGRTRVIGLARFPSI